MCFTNCKKPRLLNLIFIAGPIWCLRERGIAPIRYSSSTNNCAKELISANTSLHSPYPHCCSTCPLIVVDFLDAGSMPPRATRTGSICDYGSASQLMINDDAKHETRKPEHGGDKGKSLGRLPLPTVVTPKADVSPIPNAAAVDSVDPIDKDTEGGEPRCGEQEVKGVVQHACCGGDQPNQREEN